MSAVSAVRAVYIMSSIRGDRRVLVFRRARPAGSEFWTARCVSAEGFGLPISYHQYEYDPFGWQNPSCHRVRAITLQLR